MKINKKALGAGAAGFALTIASGTGIAMAVGSDSPDATSPAATSTQSVAGSEATEVADVSEINDGPDQGPDANASEPGHQDANEAGEASDVNEAAEAPEGNEATETD